MRQGNIRSRSLFIPEDERILGEVARHVVICLKTVNQAFHWRFVHLKAIRFIQTTIVFLFFLSFLTGIHSLLLKSKRIQLIRGQSFSIHAYNEVKNSDPMVAIGACGTSQHKTAFICCQHELKLPLTVVLKCGAGWIYCTVRAEHAAHYWGRWSTLWRFFGTLSPAFSGIGLVYVVHSFNLLQPD